MARSAIIVTTYNRPKLVADAIASVREQDDQDVSLIVMDDGSNPDNLRTLSGLMEKNFGAAQRGGAVRLQSGEVHDLRTSVAGGGVFYYPGQRIRYAALWCGPPRDHAERKRTISYSRSINIALNYLLQDEKYICYLPDDDYLHLDSIRARADFLDARPDAHACFGRQRSVQYGADGSFNRWESSGKPQPGMAFPQPTGRREHHNNGGSARVYFENGERDPQTGLDYVEEGFWEPGPQWYGKPFCTDHSQVMHRRECLTDCGIPWYGTADAGGVQYWGEDMSHGVGDAAFFRMLGARHPFVGVDVWTHTKKFSGMSDGVQFGSVRE